MNTGMKLCSHTINLNVLMNWAKYGIVTKLLANNFSNVLHHSVLWIVKIELSNVDAKCIQISKAACNVVLNIS